MNKIKKNIILKFYKYKYRFLLFGFRKNTNIFNIPYKILSLISGDLLSSKTSIVNNKKTILIIDSNIPKYNCSAGERTTWQYIEMFLDMGFEVFFMPDDFEEIQPYSEELLKKGVKCLCGDFYKKHYDVWIMGNGSLIDYVLLNRPIESVKYIDLLKQYTNAKIIYYGMDIHHIREYGQYYVTHDIEHLKLSEYFKKIELYLYRQSDIVLTVSAREEAVIKEYGYDNVKVFPAYYYKDFNVKEYIPEERKDILFVGGEKHPPNSDALIWFINEILPEFMKETGKVNFVVVGRYGKEFVEKYSTDNILFKLSVDDEELKYIYGTVKMAVIPLRFGAGIKGKTIEAGYYGIPVVSTEFGLEGLFGIYDIVSPKNSAEEFKKELISLYNDNTKLKEISLKFAEYVKNHFPYETAKEKIKNILEKK